MTIQPDEIYTSTYLRSRVGDLSHVISARTIELNDGPSLGTKAVEVRVMGGIDALILIDRGLDIGPAFFQGIPLHWTSSTGITSPSLFQDHDWLRSFHGGLLVTAGLRNVGPGFSNSDEVQPMHGRISNIPAHEINVSSGIDDDDVPILTVSGKVRETTVYGCNLLLHRTFIFKLGQPKITIKDEIINDGFSATEVMLLYHFNIGYPLVSSKSKLIVDSSTIKSHGSLEGNLDEVAKSFSDPISEFSAQVFEHQFEKQLNTRKIGIENPNLLNSGQFLKLELEYRSHELHRLWQWRMMGQGMYLTGLEPSNCGITGRGNNSGNDGTLLEPQGLLRTHLDLSVATYAKNP
jgi:hypothetical protein